jgi:hypothetical protein
MSGRENEYEGDERKVRQDQEREKGDRNVPGDKARERQAIARFARPLDLAPRDMTRDDRDEAAQAPGAEDG